MNTDTNNNALEVLADSIISVCRRFIERAKFDKTYSGVISKVNSDGYRVEYAGTSINVKTSSTNIYKIGDPVRICIPVGNKRKSFITADLDYVNAHFLRKDGGMLSGKLYERSGHGVFSFGGTGGSSGYVNFCRITLTGAWQNQPIIFKIIQRGGFRGTVTLAFSNSSTAAGHTVSQFKYSGNLKNLYIVNAASNTVWDLYIQKSETYDAIEIIDFYLGDYMTKTQIEWRNIQVSSAPSGTLASAE